MKAVSIEQRPTLCDAIKVRFTTWVINPIIVGYYHAKGGATQNIVTAMRFTSVLILLGLSGCAYENYFIPKDSYTISNRFYTFAIYNDGGRLLTHPLLDFERTLKALEEERRLLEAERALLKITHPNQRIKSDPDESRKCTKVTDVYVISHGWNYSAGEAVPNYHNYIELVDRLYDKERILRKEFKEPFCPYLILVSWTSTVRPIQDMAGGVLPFDIGEILRPVASATDKVLLHPLTAWKQSFSASAIALGTKYPDSYLYRSWYRSDKEKYGDKEVKKYGTESSYFLDQDTGYNAPLSAMLYELIRWKANPEGGPSLKDASIHIVGHSYGAKLVALASMEALRRWILIDHMLDTAFMKFVQKEIPDILKQSDDKKLLKPFIHERSLKKLEQLMQYSRPRALLEYLGVSKKDDVPDEESHNSEELENLEASWDQLLNKTGHGQWGTASPFPLELLGGGPQEQLACTELEKVLASNGGDCKDRIPTEIPKENLPISSLVLVNPALHPGEFWYPVNYHYTAPASTLKLIPRKAVIYSKYDYPNGALFNMREALFDVQGGQKYQVWLDDGSDRIFSSIRENPIFRTIATPFYAMVTGPPALVYSIVHGVTSYSLTTAINLPYDLWHHIQHNSPQSEWMPKWLKWEAPQKRISIGSFVGRVANVVDFLAPVVPFGPSRDEDLQGIFRLSRPALGKTGIVKLVAGRPAHPNLYGLQTFYDPEPKLNNALDIRADEVCRYLKESWAKKSESYEKKSDIDLQRDLSKLRAAIFSFDASKIYDSWKPPVGAHDDVRDRDEGTSCRSNALSPNQRDHLNDRLAESLPRLQVLFKECRKDSDKDKRIECRENFEALDSMEIVDIKDNVLTIAVSLVPFQERNRTFLVANRRQEKFWEKIEAPLTAELASRLTSIPSLQLIHIRKKEKREISFQFVYQFTRGELDSELIKILPSEPR